MGDHLDLLLSLIHIVLALGALRAEGLPLFSARGRSLASPRVCCRKIHYDGFRAGKYWYSDSYDNFATWTTLSHIQCFGSTPGRRSDTYP